MKLVIGIVIVVVAAVGAAQMLGGANTASAIQQAVGTATGTVRTFADGTLSEAVQDHDLPSPDELVGRVRQVVTDDRIDPYSWCAGYSAATGGDEQDCQTRRLWADPAGK